jgi:hypothetical protein
MLKTHRVTGLKYLCKTSTTNPKKPYSYCGSGKYWKWHLKKHGYSFTTEILKVCDSREELVQAGIYYSHLYNVVESCNFANMIEERGDGGPTMLGKSITREQNKKKSIALKKFHMKKTPLYNRVRNRINVLSHALIDGKIYITPAGTFSTCTAAQRVLKLSSGSIKKHCIRGFKNEIIDSRRMGREVFMKKTWKEVGYDMRDMTEKERIEIETKLAKYKNILKRINV